MYYIVALVNLLLLSVAAILAVSRQMLRCGKEKGIIYFGTYIIISFIIQSVTILLALKGINNISMCHFYTIVEFCFVVLVLQIWGKNKYNKLMVSFPLILAISLLLTPLTEIPIVAMTVSSIILSSLSARAVFVLRKKLTYKLIISFGIMCYFTQGSISSTSYLLSSKYVGMGIQNAIEFITNIIYIYGFTYEHGNANNNNSNNIFHNHFNALYGNSAPYKRKKCEG